MALINCPECERQVSNAAPFCPGCGVGISTDNEAVGSGVQHLTTTQATSKKFKAQILFATLLFWCGLFEVLLALGVETRNSTTGTLSSLAMAVGVSWYIVTKLRIWWHHV
jgi:uncharacterized membrane protein YvbJ